MQTSMSFRHQEISGGFRGVGLQGAGYDVGFKFARGGISVAAVNIVCFGLTSDKMEAERTELITIIMLLK